MGGEKQHQHDDVVQPLGSPPHGRGKAVSQGVGILGGGITPAWAGKSAPCRSEECAQKDHPRMGGEKQLLWKFPSGKPGSPPHGRGKAFNENAGIHGGGITPAWAGKRHVDSPGDCYLEDHPRMGGEKTMVEGGVETCAGSPPHGRGKG